MEVDVPSSYRSNNLGLILYDLVLKHKPSHIIEFGVFHGYSTIHMAQGLKFLRRGHVFGYDLWDRYSHNHTTIDIARGNLSKYDLADFATLDYGDFFDWLEDPEPFDMLHVDISNDGDIVEILLSKLASQINAGAIVVFEGGSPDRDQVEWMLKFNKRPINPLQNQYKLKILDYRFPSISMAVKS